MMKQRGDPVRALFSPICDLVLEILLYQTKELKKVLRDTDSEQRLIGTIRPEMRLIPCPEAMITLSQNAQQTVDIETSRCHTLNRDN